MDEAQHTKDSNLLYAKSTNLYVNLIEKHPQRNIQINVGSKIWALWLYQGEVRDYLSHSLSSVSMGWDSGSKQD